MKGSWPSTNCFLSFSLSLSIHFTLASFYQFERFAVCAYSINRKQYNWNNKCWYPSWRLANQCTNESPLNIFIAWKLRFRFAFCSLSLDYFVVCVRAKERARAQTRSIPFAVCCVKKELNTNKIINKMRWQKSFLLPMEKRWSQWSSLAVITSTIVARFDENFSFLASAFIYLFVFRISFFPSCGVHVVSFFFISICFISVYPFSFIVSKSIPCNTRFCFLVWLVSELVS